MHLTRDEEMVLQGKKGEGLKLAMEILVRLGEALEAEKFISISSGHITMPEQKADHIYVKMSQKMADYGCKVAVPTTNNPTFMDYERPGLGSPEMVSPDHPLIAAFRKMGVYNAFTCQPFFSGNLPRFGEHVGWAEASAVTFANSVLGARTNPLPAMIDLVCAILGKVPYCGLHLNENRAGKILIKVKLGTENVSELECALLGRFIAEVAGERVPVIDGLPVNVSLESLQMLGVAVPAYLFHVVGVTPEAKTVRQAFAGKKPEDTWEFGKAELKAMMEKYAALKSKDVDIVMAGCPHLSLKKVMEYARALEGKKINDNVEFYLLTSAPVRRTAMDSGFFEIIERSGAKLANMCSLFTNSAGKKSKQVLTTSNMYCMYGPGTPMLGTQQECIDAALTGKVETRR